MATLSGFEKGLGLITENKGGQGGGLVGRKDAYHPLLSVILPLFFFFFNSLAPNSEPILKLGVTTYRFLSSFLH